MNIDVKNKRKKKIENYVGCFKILLTNKSFCLLIKLFDSITEHKYQIWANTIDLFRKRKVKYKSKKQKKKNVAPQLDGKEISYVKIPKTNKKLSSSCDFYKPFSLLIKFV